MDALLMCGGRGTRLDTEREKPLFEIAGVPMVDYVVDALAESRVETVHAVVSPNTPATTEHLSGHLDPELAARIEVVETPGDGYVEDLQAAMDVVETPVLTVAADLPLLTGDAVDRVLDAFDGSSAVQVCVPAVLKRQLGVSVETSYDRDGREVAPTGINIVTSGDADADADTDTEADREIMFQTYDVRYAVNVNRRGDALLAEVLL